MECNIINMFHYFINMLCLYNIFVFAHNILMTPITSCFLAITYWWHPSHIIGPTSTWSFCLHSQTHCISLYHPPCPQNDHQPPLHDVHPSCGNHSYIIALMVCVIVLFHPVFCWKYTYPKPWHVFTLWKDYHTLICFCLIRNRLLWTMILLLLLMTVMSHRIVWYPGIPAMMNPKSWC